MMQPAPGARITNDAGAPRRRPAALERQGRMMIVAIPPDLLPPVSVGSALFHRLRIVVVSERDLDGFAPSQVVGELPPLGGSTVRVTPNAPPPRRLQGELLCDEAGRLYEKIGHYVRPVHQLVAGPGGEVLDLTPPSRRSAGGSSVIDVPDPDHDDEGERGPSRATWRELTPVSTAPRVVRFGEFKATLGPQLLHPERLRDSHRLRCSVRVFEACRPKRIDALAAEILGGASGHLIPLTPLLAARLGLSELAAPSRTPAPNREAGLVVAGERVVLLTVLQDPTTTASVDERPEPLRARTTIPDRFLAPWQFALSREEAIYDLDARSRRRGVATLIQGVARACTGGRALRKWQALLAGKGFDDQLWAVRPPDGALSRTSIREWARRTLEAGGYDAATMLREWEIYWTRKRV